MTNLAAFEGQFRDRLVALDSSSRQKAGALLPLVPERIDWERFIAEMQGNWNTLRKNPASHPHCLIALFSGLAFYEYDDASFWPHFATAVGLKEIPLHVYTKVNQAYSETLQRYGLPLLPHAGGLSYVGSAIYHIGVPLSLWDGFLDVCDWARIREDWKTMPTADWNISITKISASRTRLRKYLIDSRETASGIIKEMLDARAWLENDPALTIDSLKHACVLRREYFEEVPETADFLRPKNPESLFRDRALIVWSDRDSSIRVQLPGLSQDKMPSSWQIGNLSHPASVTPSECVLNSHAFHPSIGLKLRHATQSQEQILNGASPWGLFDLERGGILVNPRRDHLPLRSYVLVSEKPITHIEQEGFDDTEAPANQEFQFKDGSPLYVTYLYPKGRSASLSLSIGNHNHKVRFRTRDRVDARLFVGKGGQSGKFMRFDGILTLEKLPLVSVLVPQEYFRDNMATVRQQFKVLIDSRPAGGVWEKAQTKISDDAELFNWRWDTNPLLEKVKTGKIKDFRAIGEFYKSPDLRGKRTLDIVAQHYGIRFSYTICAVQFKMKHFRPEFC